MIDRWLKKHGYHPAAQCKDQALWVSWYRGKVDSFHEYSVYNGQKMVHRTRASMQMGKQICQDWASLILNERVVIESPDERFNQVLQDVLEHNDFLEQANRLVELMMAYGTAAFVLYEDEKQVAIDYVRGDMIFPLRWEGMNIIDCAFGSLRYIDGKPVYYINVHECEGHRYYVHNHLISEKGEELNLPEQLAADHFTESAEPLFQIIRPNIVNNSELESPFGISILGNSIGRLEKVDLIFDSGNNEFSLGRKRVIVPLSMTKTAVADGLGRPIFDPNDVAFYGLDLGTDATKPVDLTGQLRIAEHSQGMQDALNYLSDGVGLGTDRYEYSKAGAIKTATEVISEKSELYQNLRKHELVIERALRGLCRGIAQMTGCSPDAEVTIRFDDSIITDTDTDVQRAISLTAAGLKSKVTAMMELYNWTEEQAREELQRIEEESPEPLPDFMGL